MVIRALLVTIAALLLAGCGGKDDETGATTATVPTGTTGTGSSPVLEDAATDPVVVKGTSTDVSLLTDVRAAAHDGYDRIVFQFRNGLPGYDVRYVDRPVVADGSGDEVAVDGGAVLLIRMEPALDADLTDETAPLTYTGPQRFTPDDHRRRRARPHGRLRGRAHVGGRRRREAAVPRLDAREPGAARDRRQELRVAPGARLAACGRAC